MSSSKKTWACIAAALGMSMSSVHAAPVAYHFSTWNAMGGSAELMALLGSQTTVSGSFIYDAAGAYFGNSGALGFEPGFAVYAGPAGAVQSFYGLSGSVGGRHFSDIVGSANVGDNLPGNVDIFTLNAETTLKVGANTPPAEYPRQLAGFTLGDYTLSNVRLYWLKDTTLLSGSALPAAIPGDGGVLALDFVRTDDPTNLANAPYYSNTVFFSVRAAAVPEPASLTLVLAGLGLAVGAARRRRP